jgi:hypothetical protein
MWNYADYGGLDWARDQALCIEGSDKNLAVVEEVCSFGKIG